MPPIHFCYRGWISQNDHFVSMRIFHELQILGKMVFHSCIENDLFYLLRFTFFKNNDTLILDPLFSEFPKLRKIRRKIILQLTLLMQGLQSKSY